MLSHSTGNILDDTVLIETLAKSKVTSGEIKIKLEEASSIEKECILQSELYRPVAKRASLLYFVIADLGNVDPMYQYSLQWFTQLFVRGIGNAAGANNLDQRIINLNDSFTFSVSDYRILSVCTSYLLLPSLTFSYPLSLYISNHLLVLIQVYNNICRSLFERHKLLFSFIMCVKILQGIHFLLLCNIFLFMIIQSNLSLFLSISLTLSISPGENKIDGQEYRYLLCGISSDVSDAALPESTWLERNVWADLCCLSGLPAFKAIPTSFPEHLAEWQAIFDSSEPHKLPFPEPFNNINSLQRLCFLRCKLDLFSSSLPLFSSLS